jgi:hypothetical protein
MAHSSIPLIVHQTWKNTHIDTWTDTVRDCVEKWLEYSVNGSMAYFLWDDDGALQFLEKYEPDFVEPFTALAANVERSDVFRILVTIHIGGIVRTFPYVICSSLPLLSTQCLPTIGSFCGFNYQSTDITWRSVRRYRHLSSPAAINVDYAFRSCSLE